MKGNNLDLNRKNASAFESLIQQFYEWKTLKRRGVTIREGA